MSSSTTYFDMVASTNNYNMFCKKHDLLMYNISTEKSSFGVLESVIRFLKWLKYHISEMIRKIWRWISDKISYDNYLIIKNTIRCNKIEKEYKKLSKDKQVKVNDMFSKIQMGMTWKKEVFIESIQKFQKLCVYGIDTLQKSIESDINNIINEPSWPQKLAELNTAYGVVYDENKHEFTYEFNYDNETNQTLNELNFSNIDDAITVFAEYKKCTESYKNVLKIRHCMHRLEYVLDINIRNAKQDPTLTEEIKENTDNLKKSMTEAIKIIHHYVEFIRNFCSSINQRISSILNYCRECITNYNRNASVESYMKETTIVVTNDDEFNKRYQMLTSAIDCIKTFDKDKIYPELSLKIDDTPLKECEGITEFCKQQKDVVKLPIKLNILNDDSTLKNDIITDINRCVQNTGLAISIDEDDWLIASIYTDAPSMEYMLDNANLLSLI